MAQLVDFKDNKFYHLIKSYLQCGYAIKILSKSKKIGSRKIKIISKNLSKNFVYQGTILAPLFSNIVSSLIVKKINRKIKHQFTSNKNNGPKKVIRKFFYKTSGGFITSIYNKNSIKKKAFSFFRDDEKKAWLVNYHDTMLFLGYLSRNNKNLLWNYIKNIYEKYGFFFNESKTNMVDGITKPVSFLGYEIIKPEISKYTKNQKQISKIIIRPDKQKIIDKLLEQNIIIRRGYVSPYIIKDSGKHKKNVKKRKKQNNLITTWSISPHYKVLHYASYISENPDRIIAFFNFKMLTLKSYYKYCDQFYKLNLIFKILKISCLKTLTTKYKCGTISKLYQKFGLKLQKITNKELVKICMKTGSLLKYMQNKNKNEIEKNTFYENFEKNLNAIWLMNTKNNFGSCVICASTEKLESHYIQSVHDIRAKIKQEKYNYYNTKYILEHAKAFFEILHVIWNKKQILLCFKCYAEIESGTINENICVAEVKKLMRVL